MICVKFAYKLLHIVPEDLTVIQKYQGMITESIQVISFTLIAAPSVCITVTLMELNSPGCFNVNSRIYDPEDTSLTGRETAKTWESSREEMKRNGQDAKQMQIEKNCLYKLMEGRDIRIKIKKKVQIVGYSPSFP